MARRRFQYDPDWHGQFPPSSRPIDVAGGIRAQSKRGRFAESWWAERWIAALESFDIGERLNRGRRYARRGQVLSIEVDKGIARARVQGSRPRPYEVTVKVRPLQTAEWTRVTSQLAREAVFAARLLAGEMPRDIETAFQRAGSSLFPEKSRELATACSCPDWSNPCKHVAAVYYLLGEEFDRDPFLLFTLRGLTRDELLARLIASEPARPARRNEKRQEVSGQAASRGAMARPLAGHAGTQTTDKSRSKAPQPAAPRTEAPRSAAPRTEAPSPETLDASTFWKAAPPSDLTSNATSPPVHAEPMRLMGRFPFWRGATPLLEALEPVYARASRRALDLLTEDD
jgi:uncharacterized Zn finger protein